MNILLLRGLTRESRHWGDFPTKIESLVPGAKVFCLDLPGAGTENQKISPTTIREIRNDVRKRWLSLKKDTASWSVLGHSLGAMVTIDWLKEFPSDFKSAVLINTSAKNLSSWYRRLTFKSVMTVAGLVLKKDKIDREKTVLKMISEKQHSNVDLIQAWQKIAQDRPLARQTVIRQIMAGYKFTAPELHVKVPIYFLASRKDKMVDWRCVRELAQHYSAPFFIHEEAGHDLALDDPDWVLEKIKQLLC